MNTEIQESLARQYAVPDDLEEEVTRFLDITVVGSRSQGAREHILGVGANHRGRAELLGFLDITVAGNYN
eukprot:7251201-Pyramimonas_sp.AAC.1